MYAYTLLKIVKGANFQKKKKKTLLINKIGKNPSGL